MQSASKGRSCALAVGGELNGIEDTSSRTTKSDSKAALHFIRSLLPWCDSRPWRNLSQTRGDAPDVPSVRLSRKSRKSMGRCLGMAWYKNLSSAMALRGGRRQCGIHKFSLKASSLFFQKAI